jgi:hypothetical protein
MNKNKKSIRRRLCHSSYGYQPTALWGLLKEKGEIYWMYMIKTTASSYLDMMLQKVFGYEPHNEISEGMVKVFQDIQFLWGRGYGKKSSFWKEVLHQDGNRKTLSLLKNKLEIYKLGEKMKGL